MTMNVKGLSRSLVPIYGTTLADTLGYTLMIPLLPLVVKQYHVSEVMVGALLSVPALCSMLAAPVWGKFSDRIGRKPVIIAAQLLSLAGYVMLATTHWFAIILLSRIVSGLGGGSLGAVQSYIADVTSEERRDLAYSLYGAVFGLAFIVGPVASGFLMHGGLSIPFYVAAGLETCNVVFTAWFLPASRSQSKRSDTSLRASIEAAKAAPVRTVLVRQFLAIFAIVCFLANFALYLNHVLHSSVSNVSWLLAAAGMVGGLAMVLLVTPLASRFGDRRVAQLGLALSGVGYAILLFVTGLPVFCIALVLWAIGSAMVEPTLTALLSVRAKKEERGAVMGVGDSVNSLAMIFGPAAGSAIVAANPRLLGVLPALAAFLAFGMGMWTPSKESRQTRSAATLRSSQSS